nr:MAG TPA: hypothetical protein [Caudoviricetes sp.]
MLSAKREHLFFLDPARTCIQASPSTATIFSK